ncbi:MAG: DUF1499 domain-containing protein [Pseudomonadota bacterium]
MNPTMRTRGKPLSWPALMGLLVAMAAIVALMTAAIGIRHTWWHFSRGIELAEWAAYGAGLALVLSVIGLIQTRPGAKRRGFVPAVVGVLLALPLVGMAAHWEYAAHSYPPINDISTDIEDPPVFWDMPTPTDYPGGEKAALQRAAYPDLAPLVLAVPPDRAFAEALALVERRGWEIVARVPEEGRIEATASSRLFGFKDEIVVRVTPNNDGAKVDVRSRSRTGFIDRGVNARRIRAYLADLKRRVAG